MSEGRDATGNRDWPWERPHDELIAMEHAELHLLIAIGRALVGIEATQRTMSRHLAALRHGQETDMATLEDVQALVVQTGVDAQETEQLQAVADGLTAVDATIKGIAPVV
jgi:hypothetical protein